MSVATVDGAASRRARWVAPTVLIATILLAFWPSFAGLARDLMTDTPLAYLGLVPPVALALALFRDSPVAGRPSAPGPVAWALLAASLAVAAGGLTGSGTAWLLRLDLLALPLFATGAVLALWGPAGLGRHRAPLGFLVLTWPLPFVIVLVRVLGPMTSLTAYAVRLLLHLVPVAHSVPSETGTMFVVEHSTPFRVDVAASCSGIASAIGFLVVGTACLAVVEGPRRRKAAWLAAGFVVTWLMNVARILLLVVLGRTFGRHVAMDWFHPYLGLVTFNVAVVTMLLLLRRVGLRLPAAPLDAPAPPSALRPVVVAVVVAVALVLGVATGAAVDHRLVGTVAGRERSPLQLASVEGLELPRGRRVAWAERFFGEDASWVRVTDGTGSGAVTVDVLSTTDQAALEQFGLEVWFRLQGWRTIRAKKTELDGGVPAIELGGGRAIWWVDRVDGHYEQVIVSAARAGRARRVADALARDGRPTSTSVVAVPKPSRSSTPGVRNGTGTSS